MLLRLTRRAWKCNTSVSKTRIAIVLAAFAVLMTPQAAAADALFDQTTGTPAGTVNLDGLTYLADDFSVPQGPGWLIDNAHFEGQGGAGEKFNAFILQDSGGLPNSQLASSIGQSTKVDATGNFDTPAPKKFKYVSDLPYGTGLLPGHYWLALAQVLSPNQTPTPWAWRTQSPQSGSEAAIYNGLDWLHLSDAGKTGPDFRFRIDGEPISSDASRFKLGKPIRRPGGAILVLANFPGEGTPQVKLTSGKKWVKPLKLHSNVFGTHLKFKPTAKAKRKYRDGKRLKFSAKVTYARSFTAQESIQPFLAPPTTQTLHLVFKKPKQTGP
jgi:hypothetical protein